MDNLNGNIGKSPNEKSYLNRKSEALVNASLYWEIGSFEVVGRTLQTAGLTVYEQWRRMKNKIQFAKEMAKCSHNHH